MRQPGVLTPGMVTMEGSKSREATAFERVNYKCRRFATLVFRGHMGPGVVTPGYPMPSLRDSRVSRAHGTWGYYPRLSNAVASRLTYSLTHLLTICTKT